VFEKELFIYIIERIVQRNLYRYKYIERKKEKFFESLLSSLFDFSF
jgi:hypothetical protein